MIELEVISIQQARQYAFTLQLDEIKWLFAKYNDLNNLSEPWTEFNFSSQQL